MIGKIRKGASFYGLLRYLAKNPHATRLDSSVAPASREAAAELAAIAHAAGKLQKPVRHLMVRLPAEESLAADDWRYIAAVVLSRMGYEESPAVVWLHDDPAGAHVHLVTTARDYAGRYVSDSNDHHRIQVVLRGLERELGLRAPTPREPRVPQSEAPFRALAAPEDRVAIAERVRQVAARAPHFDAFVASLGEMGYAVRAQWGSRGTKLRGLAFTAPGGVSVKASELDRVLRRPPLWEEFPALHRRGAEVLVERSETIRDASRPVPGHEVEGPRTPADRGLEGRLAARVREALAGARSFRNFARRLEASGWSPRIVARGSAYGLRFEELRPRGAGGAWRPRRIAGSRLGHGFGLLALSRRFPHIFAEAVASRPRRAFEVDAAAASRLVAFDVPAPLRSRLKLDPRFLAFAGGTFLATQRSARELADRYGLVARPVAAGERALRNPFGFAGGSAALRDAETYRLSRLRGLAHRVLATHDPGSREAVRQLERLDRFAERVAPESPSLALQILVQLPGCPTRSYRPAARLAAPVSLVALTGPAAERQRLRETGLVVAAQEGNLWIDRAHLAHVERTVPGLWVNDLAPRPAAEAAVAETRGAADREAEVAPPVRSPLAARVAERLAARDPAQVPAASLLYLRALREPADRLAESSPAEALARFLRGDRSSLNLLALASRPPRLRAPGSARELAAFLSAERALTARILRVARSASPDLGKASTLAGELLAVRQAVDARLRREVGLREPPDPGRGRATGLSLGDALGSVPSLALASLTHLNRAAAYWTALYAEDPARAVGRLAMTGLPPFRHAARFAAAVRGDDPLLSIARLYLVDGAIRAAAVLAPKPLAAILTTVRALSAAVRTVFSLGEERGRGR